MKKTSHARTARRELLGGAAATAATAVLGGFPHVAGAQAKAIRVGFPTILSGRVAILGTSSRAGIEPLKRLNTFWKF